MVQDVFCHLSEKVEYILNGILRFVLLKQQVGITPPGKSVLHLESSKQPHESAVLFHRIIREMYKIT